MQRKDEKNRDKVEEKKEVIAVKKLSAAAVQVLLQFEGLSLGDCLMLG